MLDAAEQAFTEYGYDGASLEEICRRAGLKRPLFYTYFGNKEGLYLACHRRARAELDERITHAAARVSTDENTPQALLEIHAAIAHAYFDFLATSPSRWDMLYGPGAATPDRSPRRSPCCATRLSTLLAALIRHYAPSDLDDDTILVFAHASSGSGEQLARWWRRNPKIAIDQLADLAARYSWAGVSQLYSAPEQ